MRRQTKSFPSFFTVIHRATVDRQEAVHRGIGVPFRKVFDIALSTSDRDHFETLSRAVRDGTCRLVEWHVFGSGLRIPGIGAVQRQPDGPQTLVPLALLFTGKPSTTLIIPHPEYAGFAAPEEILSGMPR